MANTAALCQEEKNPSPAFLKNKHFTFVNLGLAGTVMEHDVCS